MILDYRKRLSAALKEKGIAEDKIKEITEGIRMYAAKKMAKRIKDYEPYVGESYSDKAMYASPIPCLQVLGLTETFDQAYISQFS